ncbi:MAG: DMT family transporter [Eisenbergiella sp.]
MFQQYGIQYTTVGKAGFITTLYIIIVPIMGLFIGKKVRRIVWAGAALAAAGMYLLCVNETLSLNKGDLLVFICAVIFSIHILVIDYFSPKADGVKLSCIQFFVAGIICTIGAFLVETPTWSAGERRGAGTVCGCHVLRRGLYPADHRTEESGSDGGIPDSQPESVVSVWQAGDTEPDHGKEIFGCVLVFAAVIWCSFRKRAAAGGGSEVG